MARDELARFLRVRREILRAGDLGLPPRARRRTPGLRREEVAELAHVSVDYYTRLEQARGPHPSAQVLDALTSAFRLTAAERTHLFRLADVAPTAPTSPVRHVRPSVRQLLNRLPATAAIVTDAGYDVVAANPLATALLDLDAGSNLARRRFLDPSRAREVAASQGFERIAVSRLRTAARRYPRDRQITELVTELRAKSPEFRVLWTTDPVHAPGHRAKTLQHPELGPLQVSCDVLVVPDDDQQVVFMTADPGTHSARVLERLVS
ncbi:XRE family transcriptional regulator [Kribbella capetownensis]|uniref:XRE family transcriptional regulator n=1 Tax=Kribbella capetownensis TaxID=1572659 RepID=A0A4R0K0G9_9ACTN|nr:helix-turn-helix transcriptional regulator [Kribbella capetownensis]TCC53391.1 XRE family transcriptional regulator [Kribbella capetownensis]